MFLTKDRMGALFLLVFCLFYGWKIGDIRLLPFQANHAFTARTMPEIFAILGVGLSLLILIFPSNRERVVISQFNWPLGLAFLALMSVYGLSIRPLGFLLSTTVFLMIGFAMLGERNPVKLFLASAPLVVISWMLMIFVLNVFIEPLPFFLKG